MGFYARMVISNIFRNFFFCFCIYLVIILSNTIVYAFPKDHEMLIKHIYNDNIYFTLKMYNSGLTPELIQHFIDNADK